MKIEQNNIRIRSKHGWFDLNFKELMQYKDLILMFVKRDWETTYKQTILGPFWAVLQPLFMTFVFSLIFGRIAKIPTDNVPPLLFYLAGLLPWNYFSGSFQKTCNTFSANAHLFGKVYFPRLTVPLSYLISASIGFFINLGIFVVILTFMPYQASPDLYSLLMLPLLLLLTALFSLGLGLIVASLTIKYRDLAFLITFGMQLFMYATPIIYPLSIIPEKYKVFFMLNPLAFVTESFRKGLLGIGNVNLNQMMYSISFILITFLIGILLFNKTEKSFIDTF